ncbi:MAG: NADH-quinone oxidoreductase subunit I [Deltaproteobacteria bacterium]|nr:NADH-quinone oxidoreductase subunit I [Deltaproteobacteria bacterium]
MNIAIKRKPLSLWEKIYVPEILRGMVITAKHLFKNLVSPEKMMTHSWPDEHKPIPENYRCEHRLMLRDHGAIRCTACMLCATACPSNCIHITAAEGENPAAEKYAEEYTIDHLRCIYCGFCVEACPCDAIRMDTQRPVSSGFSREFFIRDINYLKNNHGTKAPYSEARYP